MGADVDLLKSKYKSNLSLPFGKVRMGSRLGGAEVQLQGNLFLPFGKVRMGLKVRMGSRLGGG